MEMKDLRGKKKKDLMVLLRDARLELGRLRLEKKVGSLTDPSEIRKKRREVARIATVFKEKEILEKLEKPASESSSPSLEEKDSPGRKVKKERGSRPSKK